MKKNIRFPNFNTKSLIMSYTKKPTPCKTPSDSSEYLKLNPGPEILCDWCHNPGSKHNCFSQYESNFCSSYCLTAWGNSDMCPKLPENDKSRFIRPDYGGSLA